LTALNAALVLMCAQAKFRLYITTAKRKQKFATLLVKKERPKWLVNALKRAKSALSVRSKSVLNGIVKRQKPARKRKRKPWRKAATIRKTPCKQPLPELKHEKSHKQQRLNKTIKKVTTHDL